ncbi:MAG TPA: MlaD family protein, partial [Vicinamibacteria bacterium]|nr:MlaD family protein [Vicinamibacteria bacterium]
VLVIVSLVVLAGTILYVGSGGMSPFAPKYTIKAMMSDVNGLKPGAPVRLGGVEVGTVDKVELSPRGKGMVEVTMSLDRRVQARITDRSQVSLGSLGLLGEKAVDISGSEEGTPIPEGGYAQASLEDPLKGLLTDASGSTAHLRRILARMDAGEGLIGKALRDEELYDRMTDVSERLQGTMTRLESSNGPLGRLINDRQMSAQIASSARGINSVVGRIEAGQGTIGVLTQDDQVARDLKEVTASLKEVASSLQQGKGTAGRLLSDDALFQKLDTVATRLDRVTARLEKGDGTAGRLLQDAELYNNLNSAAREMRGLMSDIRKDPRKYLRLKLSLF